MPVFAYLRVLVCVCAGAQVRVRACTRKRACLRARACVSALEMIMITRNIHKMIICSNENEEVQGRKLFMKRGNETKNGKRYFAHVHVPLYQNEARIS